MKQREALRKSIEKEFLYSKEELFRMRISVKDMNSPNISFDSMTNSQSRLCIKEKVPGGTMFFYAGYDEINSLDALKENPHFVTFDNKIIYAAKTKEEAENYVELFVGKALGIIKETEQAKNEELQEAKSKRKAALVPPQLQHIQRTGQAVRTKNAEGQDFIDTFKIRGGEFGNWLDDKDRQANMNFAFDSFKDIGTALGIEDESVGLNGKLAIAFGARGSGNALAHYEPLREVINLTKMKGAGSLAHEYFHAIDDIVGREKGCGGYITQNPRAMESVAKLVSALKYKEVTIDSDTLLQEKAARKQQDEKKVERYSNSIKRHIDQLIPNNGLTADQIAQKEKLVGELLESVPQFQFGHSKSLFAKVEPLEQLSMLRKQLYGRVIPAADRDTILRTQNSIAVTKKSLADTTIPEPVTRRVETDFYKDAQTIDALYSRSGHGYWQSEIELAARAFACYIKDKLAEKGIRNDYLCGHADQMPIPHEGKMLYINPVGEERAAINKAFDSVIVELKRIGFVAEKKQSFDNIVKSAQDKAMPCTVKTSSKDKTL